MIDCPISGARGTQQPTGLGTNGVLLLGEAMGQQEADEGRGFVESAPAGSVLERAIRRSGFRREQFVVWNVVPVQPPNNYLEGAPYEADAIQWGLGLLDEIVSRYRPRCILALGNVALKATTGLSGVMEARGFPLPCPRYGIPVIGTLHPAFLRRGAMAYLSVLMHDLKFAVALAALGDRERVEFWSPVLWHQVSYIRPILGPRNEPVVPPDYCCYPSESDARDFLRQVESDSTRLVAYDIETPWSPTKGEDETDEDDRNDQAGDSIVSIQFSVAPGSGIFMPWRPPFIEIAHAVLGTRNPKVGANNWRFDDPRLRLTGCEIGGTRHDIRWAFKHLQPDLSGGLQFITSFYAPELGPWKMLHASHPAFYGIRDVDALMRII